MKLERVVAAGSIALLSPFLLRSDDSRTFHTTAGQAYSLTISIDKPESFTGRVGVEVRDTRGVIVAKPLHPFDLDLSVNLQPHGDVTVKLTRADQVHIDFVPLHLSGDDAIALFPNGTWQQAQTIRFGQTVHGSGDDRPYVPVSMDRAYADLVSGFQWFRFTVPGDKSRLAHFVLETPDRDVPPDVDIFVASAAGIEPYREGASAYNPEATQNFPGLSPFRARVVHSGQTYYLRVAPNHPEYTLRTLIYDVPPYRDPGKAVEAGMDYLIALGDAWHANTPRRGAIALRNTMPHAEPAACIACHPTQFTVRGYLTAAKNGYPVHHPNQLRFLTDRLANNPRPLYGHENADWARVIFSARTVASRVPVLLDMAGIRAPDVTRGFAEYLRKTSLEDEADGSLPFVSAFEIGLQSWETFGLAGFTADRDRIRDEVIARKPANTIDLAWKITALAKFGESADAEIDQLYEKQDADGRFSPADFITYQALYALATAGRRADPQVAKTVAYALSKQRTDGSWQGDPIYKGFDTPFRDTQFAVMALSELFPETRTPIGTATVRERSALGSPSKIEQRRAAVTLRHPDAIPTLLESLRSTDGRTRWGALRVFAKDFRALTENPALLTALKNELTDPMPANRFQSANALWRWYQWQRDNSILDTLAKRLGEETDLYVRRGLIESVYNILDENAGQMEAWQRTMTAEPDRKKTEEAFHRAVRDQAAVIARNLESGNRDLRLGVLTALWDFHLRHMAIPDDNRQKVDVILPAFFADYSAGVPRLHEPSFTYEPYAETADFAYKASNDFHVTRLGNDTDLPHFFKDSGPAMENALLKCLDGADREMTMQVIKASSILGDSETTSFTAAMLRLLQSPDAEVRSAVRYVYASNARGRLTLGSPDEPDPSLQKLLTQLIDSRQPDVLAVALPLLAELPVGSTFTRDQPLAWSVEKLVREDSVPAPVLRAAAVFPSIADTPLMRTEILRALKSNDYETQQAAIDLVLARYVTDPSTDELTRQFIAATQGRARAVLIDKLDPNKYALRLSAVSSYRAVSGEPLPVDDNLFSSRPVQEAVAASLEDKSPAVREAARDLVREQPKLQQIANVPPPARSTPDFEYFVQKIQPILSARGSDGKACVMCHATHAIYKLTASPRDNYTNTLKVINTREPRKSLLLIKPTRPNDAVGDANLYLATHNGGERWHRNEDSPEYEMILEWIRGAKLPMAVDERR
jgi:hypothetical protein